MKINKGILHLEVWGRIPLSSMSREIESDLRDRNRAEIVGPLAGYVPPFTSNVDSGSAGDRI